MSKTWKAPNGEDYPVVESTVGTRLHVTADDIDSAVPFDPFNCALAIHCKAKLNAPEAMIGAAIAYIVTPINGEYVAMKYQVPRRTRRAIDLFDQTGQMPEEGFDLQPLRASRRGEAYAAAMKRDNATRTERRRRAKELGIPPTPNRKSPRQALLRTRSASGQVRTRDEA